MTRGRRNAPRRAAAIGAVISGLVLGAGACGGSVMTTGPDGGPDAGSTGGHGGHDGGNPGNITISRLVTGGIDKLDLVLMIDNSRSMADKQAILAATVPDLVRGLANPDCLDDNGLPAAQQPAGPLDACPAGTRRRFHPITDIHVGIITSSIGGHGSDACPNVETTTCGAGEMNTTNNDMGHLIDRQDPCTTASIPTYQNEGFLAWDPTGMDTPPGTKDLGSITYEPTTGLIATVSSGLVSTLKDMVLGTGQIGCGYEASLESWYRFLADPEPYQTITVNSNGVATPMGIDDVLIQQRTDFLRASSLLAIIALSDENDCSTKEYGQYYFANQQRDPSNPNKNFYLPKPRSECATNPNDPCCVSCGQATPAGCPQDPNCATGPLDAVTDDVNLRCFDQKRRFGIDFLYPIDRYTTALTQPLIPNRAGEMVPNPIYSVLNPQGGDAFVRDSTLVLYTTLAGVPWQDLARDPTNLQKGYKNAGEMNVPDSSGHSTWDYVIGDPAAYHQPLDPHMIESSAPRSGTNPITGDTLAAPSPTEGGSDKINGHEYTTGTKNGVQVAPDDLEYACIFKIPTPHDCSDPTAVACDCFDPMNDSPLCADNPGKGRTLQTHAKAYPGIRQLALVKALGTQGLAGSICPAQLTDPSASDFGYRPAIQGILDRLTPVVDVGCFPKQLPVDTAGHIACTVVEAKNTGMHLDEAACASHCAMVPGRAALTGAQAALRTDALADPTAVAMGADCVCEIPQLGGTPGCQSIQSELGACECDPSDAPVFGNMPVNGWCYVDAVQDVGNPAIVQDCPMNQKRLLRFVGAGQPTTNSVALLACSAP